MGLFIIKNQRSNLPHSIYHIRLGSLPLGSRKPETKAFKRWVKQEVLPAIRKTSKYDAVSIVRSAYEVRAVVVDGETWFVTK